MESSIQNIDLDGMIDFPLYIMRPKGLFGELIGFNILGELLHEQQQKFALVYSAWNTCIIAHFLWLQNLDFLMFVQL